MEFNKTKWGDKKLLSGADSYMEAKDNENF